MFNQLIYKKKLRKKLKLIGICTTCYHNKSISGKTRCQLCSNKHSKYNKLLYKKRLQNGKCYRHPKLNVVKGITMCKICSKEMQIRNKKRLQYSHKNKKCINHPTVNVALGAKTRCPECCWKQILRNHNLIDIQATKILDRQNYICPLSGIKLIKGINASVDHINHKCNGGTNDISNLRFIDKDVNFLRSHYSDNKLVRLCIKIAKYNRRKNV